MDVSGARITRLEQLQQWMLAGWWIEEPVFQRNAYHGCDGRVSVFEMVVCQHGDRRALALCDDPEVYRFLGDQGLSVLEVA